MWEEAGERGEGEVVVGRFVYFVEEEEESFLFDPFLVSVLVRRIEDLRDPDWEAIEY